MEKYFPLECHETLERIGQLVKQKRLSLRQRQADLAQSVGVSTPTIGRIEAGERGVELGTFLHVLWQLGLLDQVLQPLAALESEPNTAQRVRLKHVSTDDF